MSAYEHPQLGAELLSLLFTDPSIPIVLAIDGPAGEYRRLGSVSYAFVIEDQYGIEGIEEGDIAQPKGVRCLLLKP